MAPTTEERVHHPYSPSQLQSLEACVRFKGKESKHERTVAGSRAHAMVETKQDDQRLSDYDAAAAAECIDFVETRKQAVQKMFPAGPVRELKEIYLPIDEEIFEDAEATTAGFVDTALVSHCETYAELADWKFGYWKVESADNNLQALAYVLGLFKMFPKLNMIRFFFKLPNVQGFSEVVMMRDEIPAVYLRIQVVVARARKARLSGSYDDATPQSPLCSFCANIADCPKVLALMTNAAKKFYPLSVPDNITPTAILSSRDTSMCLRLAQTAKTWAEAFKTRVTDRVLRGDADLPENCHIETRDGKRSVADEEKFKNVTLVYLTPEEYSKVTPVPDFGVVEAAIQEKTPRGSKTAVLKQYKSDLEAAGATEKGQPYSFLKWSNDREQDKAAQQQAVINSLK